MKLQAVRLQPQRHRRAAGGHPWVYSNEIVMDSAVKNIAPGTMVSFHAHDQMLLGTGSFNPHTLIAGRIFAPRALVNIDKDWLTARLQSALNLRTRLLDEPFYRLVHAEADGLPGLIIDRFGDHLSVQLNTAGMQNLWPEIEAALEDLLQPETIVLHNESGARALEGLEKSVSIAKGELSAPIEVRENGITYYADLVSGQKTGWYFDQRDSHALLANYAARMENPRLLDLYTHAGGFGLLAAKAGAEIIGVDSSQPALDLAAKAAAKNKLTKKCSWVRADVFEDLERRIAAKEKFEIVIADPPAFVKARKDLASGSKGYRKLARLSAQTVAPGGLFYIASCSHNMELNLLIEEVARGLQEARRSGRILHTVFAAPDHPLHPQLPESGYLKALIYQLD